MAATRSRTRWAAVALALAITIPYAVVFAQTVRAAVDPDSISEEMRLQLASLLGWGDQMGLAFSYMAAVLGTVILVVLLVIVGLVARRQAAREAGFAVFGGIAVVAGASAVGRLVGAGETSGPILAAVTAGACLGVLILLAMQSTADDFGQAEVDRLRRREAR